MTTSFFVAGDPKGQPRPRAFAMKMGNGKFSARVFDSGTAEEWKSLIAVAARPHRLAAPLEGPVALVLYFVFARPKKHFRANTPEKGLRADAPFFVTGKPDIDNCAKAVMDALTQIGGFWRDDSQVASLEMTKTFEGPAGCTIRIRSLSEQPAPAQSQTRMELAQRDGRCPRDGNECERAGDGSHCCAENSVNCRP